jgi:hypothetical protein
MLTISLLKMRVPVVFLLMLSSCELVPTTEILATASRRDANYLLVASTAWNSNYYFVSPSGSDTNDGHSSTSAFQTIGQLNKQTFKKGDRILFETGQTFTGSLKLQGNATLDAAQPVIITSYDASANAAAADSAKATILTTGSEPAISLADFPGVEVLNLKLVNGGSSKFGVEVSVVGSDAPVAHTTLANLEVAGFGEIGIALHSVKHQGLKDVVVDKCVLHDNGSAGLMSYADTWPERTHANITVTNTTAYHNEGTGSTKDNSGSGIVLSCVNGGLIDHCEAYANGAKNGHHGGGPMGIWCYDAQHVTIQYCESHHNITSLDADGGGFDIDGGSAYCTIQYCYSHDNQGEGYGLFEFGSPNAWHDNTVKFNISINDGLHAGLGSIAFWAKEGSSIAKATVANNTVVGALGFRIDNNNASDIVLVNNIVNAATFSNTTNFTGFQLSNNYTDPVAFVDGYHLPSGSPLAKSGKKLGPNRQAVDYYQQSLRGAYPIGASK